MPGIVRCDQINLNNPQEVNALLKCLAILLATPSHRFSLAVVGKYYFNIPNGPITNDSGWYIIYSGSDGKPLYVGTATDLNSRLNTNAGSRDNFANPQRNTDDARNIIKKFVIIGIIPSLQVHVLSEQLLCKSMGLTPPLTKRDRENVEKVLNLFRS